MKDTINIFNYFDGKYRNAILETLQLAPIEDDAFLNGVTRFFDVMGSFYFEAYFYLSKRFGEPDIYDEDKDAGVWIFKVKQYEVQLILDSSRLLILICGDIDEAPKESDTPGLIAYRRAYKKTDKSKFFTHANNTNDLTQIEREVNQAVFETFANENSIDYTWSQERFEKEKRHDWILYVERYNIKQVGVSISEFNKKHGDTYTNSYKRHALRTLRQFLKNMLSPIYIRDCSFNIKGRCDWSYERFKDNIEIERINP